MSNEDLERHKDNILNFIGNNCEYIKKNIILKAGFSKVYLEQILLMLPSCFYFKKTCKSIIYKCIGICKNLDLNYFKLSIFLISLKQELKEEDEDYKNFSLIFNENKNNKYFNESTFNELKGEAYFLKGLKLEKKKAFGEAIKSFEEAIKLFEKIINKEMKIRIAYANYEIGLIYFIEKKYDEAKNSLKEAQRISNENKDDFLEQRCNIDLALNLYKQSSDKLESKERINNLLMKVINKNVGFNGQTNAITSLKREAYRLKLALNQYLEPDITILSSNPLNNNCSVLGRGIFSHYNNQYYLLQKLNEKINSNIKIDFRLLNKNENEDNLLGDNLFESFNKKGKILIIQSDDFTNNGEIILESKYGESELLTNNMLDNKFPVKKINYEIVILCFINSIRLKDIFKDKTNFLITFNEIDYKEFNYYSLFEYNKLSIDFLINFIE